MTSTPTRPVDNVVIATKGLQDRNINILAGTRVENKGKLILTKKNYTNLSARAYQPTAGSLWLLPKDSILEKVSLNYINLIVFYYFF